MLRGFILSAIIISGIALTHGEPAHAATLKANEGAAFVNSGTGFKPTFGTVVVAEGSRVMVSPGQTAVIAYNASCSVRIGSGRLWTVAGKAPCAPGRTMVDFTSRMNATEGEQPPEWQDPSVVEQTQLPGPGIGTQLLIGAAVVGGIVGVVVAVSDDDKKDPPPASP